MAITVSNHRKVLIGTEQRSAKTG